MVPWGSDRTGTLYTVKEVIILLRGRFKEQFIPILPQVSRLVISSASFPFITLIDI